MAIVALLAAAAATPSANLKVYHLNPISAGVVPVNMDTGDAAGDLYFYLGQFILPLECANGSKAFDCQNPERRDPSLVVTEVDMEVDTSYTVYSACNLCNGTDPFTNKTCKLGSYVCDCFDFGHGSSCDRTKVGIENVTEGFAHVTSPLCKKGLNQLCPVPAGTTNDTECDNCLGKYSDELKNNYTCVQSDLYHYCPSPYSCSPEHPDWTCWRNNIVRKTGGFWYSTLGEGQCADGQNSSCSWKVTGTKTVNETCMHESIVDVVEESAPACFQDCVQPRNESSACWINCFFDAILGPEARNSSTAPLSGLPLSKLEEGWTRAFNGRCPLIPAVSA